MAVILSNIGKRMKEVWVSENVFFASIYVF